MIRMEMGSEMKNKLRKKKEDKGICMGKCWILIGIWNCVRIITILTSYDFTHS